MNREIKFRLWNKKEKKWELGYDYGNLGGFSMIGEVMLFGEYNRVINSVPISELDIFEISQFTGLLDRHGKEIYEGDLVTYATDIHQEIVFKNCAFTFRGTELALGLFKREKMEVVGNVYENSELLKDGK